MFGYPSQELQCTDGFILILKIPLQSYSKKVSVAINHYPHVWYPTDNDVTLFFIILWLLGPPFPHHSSDGERYPYLFAIAINYYIGTPQYIMHCIGLSGILANPWSHTHPFAQTSNSLVDSMKMASEGHFMYSIDPIVPLLSAISSLQHNSRQAPHNALLLCWLFIAKNTYSDTQCYVLSHLRNETAELLLAILDSSRTLVGATVYLRSAKFVL